jgi:Pentapeptide repeats (8 copies)
MANQEQLDILKQGAQAWNQWRRENPTILPDLRGADLTNSNLSEETNLSYADLDGATLNGAILSGADLSSATLSEANLSEAYLNGADLSYAFLYRANLSKACLNGADLHRAHLLRANLHGADLSSATLNRATLNDATLSQASVADVRWGEVNLAVVDWEPIKRLGDEYEARSSRKLFDYQGAVRANRQLAVVLRDQGLNEEADRFAYRAQLLQRVVWRKRGRPLKYLFSLFLDLLAGYGYRPGRTLLWYVLVIVGFATAYALIGQLSAFPDTLVFSLMSFHGRGFFPSLNGETLHNRLVVVASIEAVVGLFIEISFIATFTQRFFGR